MRLYDPEAGGAKAAEYQSDSKMNIAYKKNFPLPKNRLFGGEGWKPLDGQSLRQMCRGVKVDLPWDDLRTAPNRFHSRKPLPIVDHGPERPNLTGMMRGESVMIAGYFGSISGRHYWVAACLCGCFELLNERTLVEKPVSPSHLCPECSIVERQRYLEQCLEESRAAGLDFEEVRRQYKAVRQNGQASKRNSFGLIHFIRKLAQAK